MDWPLSGHELASRLSYLLWSSMPDDKLFALAREGKLGNPDVLRAEVDRMLADDKARAFTRHFAGRWFGFDEEFAIDPRPYPEFRDENLRRDLREEVFRICDHVLRGEGKATGFLDSEFTFLNARVAKHYGIEGIEGEDWRRVKLPDKRRGGLLGTGAILAQTSFPQRTSPVLRGKWVIEELLGTPAPPPPDNVGDLPEKESDFRGKSLRARLEAHRDKDSCRGCHARLDPPGFALEHFSPTGRWRDKVQGQPVEAESVFPDGTKVTGPAELRAYLMTRRDLFARTFCRRLLGYALERGLTPADQPLLVTLEKQFERSEYRVGDLIGEIVTSYAFTHRMGRPETKP